MGGSHPKVRIGHPSGVLTVEAEASGGWRVTKAVLTRTARRLMSGWVYVPRELL